MGRWMSRKEITPAALKMAGKMIRTISRRYGISRRDADRMLNLATLLALEDLVESGAAEWIRTPPPGVLVLERDSARLGKPQRDPPILTSGPKDRDIEEANDRLEELFERYELPEVERATLLTALPCVGIHALRDFVRWKEEPPFAELG